MKKKLLFVITKSNWGGAQRYVFDLASSFKKDFDVVVATGGDGPLVNKLLAIGVRVEKVSSLARDINVQKERASFFEILKLFARERPDIIHLNSSKAGGLGALAGRFYAIFNNTRPHIVFTAHGWAFKEERSLPWRVAVRFLSWVTVVLSHRTIVVSQDDLNRARWMPFVQSKIRLVRNGIGPIEKVGRTKSRSLLEKRLGTPLPEDSVWIGTIAELHPNKGLGYLIEAMEKVTEWHPRARCVLVGDGELRSELERLATKTASRTVQFVGHLENAATYLDAFDIFVLPSLKEGLPYTLLEAGATRLPVVATSVGGIPEIVEDLHSGILVRPKNSPELAGALDLLLRETRRGHVYGDALYETVVQTYGLERMVKETQLVYMEIDRTAAVR